MEMKKEELNEKRVRNLDLVEQYRYPRSKSSDVPKNTYHLKLTNSKEKQDALHRRRMDERALKMAKFCFSNLNSRAKILHF